MCLAPRSTYQRRYFPQRQRLNPRSTPVIKSINSRIGVNRAFPGHPGMRNMHLATPLPYFSCPSPLPPLPPFALQATLPRHKGPFTPPQAIRNLGPRISATTPALSRTHLHRENDDPPSIRSTKSLGKGTRETLRVLRIRGGFGNRGVPRNDTEKAMGKAVQRTG